MTTSAFQNGGRSDERGADYLMPLQLGSASLFGGTAMPLPPSYTAQHSGQYDGFQQQGHGHLMYSTFDYAAAAYACTDASASGPDGAFGSPVAFGADTAATAAARGGYSQLQQLDHGQQLHALAAAAAPAAADWTPSWLTGLHYSGDPSHASFLLLQPPVHYSGARAPPQAAPQRLVAGSFSGTPASRAPDGSLMLWDLQATAAPTPVSSLHAKALSHAGFGHTTCCIRIGEFLTTTAGHNRQVFACLQRHRCLVGQQTLHSLHPSCLCFQHNSQDLWTVRMCLFEQVKPRWPSHDGGGGSPPTASAFYYTPFGIDSPFKELNLNPMNFRRDCGRQCSSSATSAKACADANPDEHGNPCAELHAASCIWAATSARLHWQPRRCLPVLWRR